MDTGQAVGSVPGASVQASGPTVIVDRRAGEPLPFVGVEMRWGTVPGGLYSLSGYEKRVAVEVLSLPELVRCVSSQRARLWRRLEKLAWYQTGAVVVPSGLPELLLHGYTSKVMPASVLGSVHAITLDFGLPVIWAGTRAAAAQWVLSFLRLAARRIEEAASCGKPKDGERY
jgi:hypothetical protein